MVIILGAESKVGNLLKFDGMGVNEKKLHFNWTLTVIPSLLSGQNVANLGNQSKTTRGLSEGFSPIRLKS